MILDIFLGLLVAKLSTMYFSVPLTPALIIGGMLFCLLPDLDLFKLAMKKGARDRAQDYTHRDFIHYPIPYILIGTIVAAFLGGPVWASLFFFGSLLHFIHDSIGIGWGVKWLYPFSKKSYAFFYHYDVNRNKLQKKLVYAWTPQEIQQLSKLGDKDWVKNIYFSLHPYSLAEHGLSLLILVFILMV